MPCLTNIPKPMIFFLWYFTKHYSDINHTNLLPNDVKLQKFTLQSTAEHLMQSGWTCCALQQCNAPISSKQSSTIFCNIEQYSELPVQCTHLKKEILHKVQQYSATSNNILNCAILFCTEVVLGSAAWHRSLGHNSHHLNINPEISSNPILIIIVL